VFVLGCDWKLLVICAGFSGYVLFSHDQLLSLTISYGVGHTGGKDLL